jgi:hypothetical protein
MVDIILRAGEASPKDVRLRDPTIPDGGSAISAVVDATLGVATLVATDTVVVASALSKTLSGATLSASAVVKVDASLTKTLAPSTLAATGATPAGLTLEKTLAPARGRRTSRERWRPC